MMEKLNITSRARPWTDRFPLTGRYTYGIAGERFFRELKENARIMGARCAHCNITYVPPRLYCERCFAELEEWVEVPATGVVHTFSVVYYDLEEQPLAEPEIIAFIQLDDADGGLVHRLGEVAPEDVYVGMPVEAVFKPPEEREGSITDIRYFRPISFES